MKLKLLAKMILVIMVPAIVGLGGLAFTTDYLATKALNKQIDNDLDQMATLLANNIENVVGVLGNANATLTQTGYVQDFLQLVASGNKEAVQAASPSLTAYLVTVRKNYPRMRDIAITDAKGVIVAHTNPARLGASLGEQKAFTTAMQGQRGTSMQYDKNNNTAVALLGSPVLNAKGEIIGTACVNTDLNVLSTTTVDTIKVGVTGLSFVFDNAGTIIMHANRKLVGQSFANMDWAQQMLRGKEGTLVYTYDGMTKLAFYDTIPSLGWKVGISAAESDLLSSVHSLSNTSMLLAAAVILVVGLLILVFARQLVGALRNCAGIAEHVAEGNLTLTSQQKIELDKSSHRSDELGALATAIGTMIDNLGSLFKNAEDKNKEAEQATAAADEARKNAEAATRRAESAKREGMLAAANQLEETLNVIVSASTELSAQVEQSERGASLQADRMSETATAMEEMNSTVLEVAKNASAASDVSASTRQKAEAGASVVQQAVRSIQEVQEQSVQLRGDMVRLDENAKSISQIMGVISDIADQTNLLALNAAIEAARAGEAGRGFAVVADEVRKLAEKTMASTTDVGNAIRAIQNSAAQSMTQVDASSKKIEEATALANQSGSNLAEIVAMVDSTADQVRAIATASEQQSSSSEEINESITQVNSIASETSRAMGEAARAVTDLAHQAQVLKTLIDNMKAGD